MMKLRITDDAGIRVCFLRDCLVLILIVARGGRFCVEN